MGLDGRKQVPKIGNTRFPYTQAGKEAAKKMRDMAKGMMGGSPKKTVRRVSKKK